MATMREERIISILAELSNRIASANTTMTDLQDDFNQSRRPSMQIRKRAQKCMSDTNVFIERYESIFASFGFDSDSYGYKRFSSRVKTFYYFSEFFK